MGFLRDFFMEEPKKKEIIKKQDIIEDIQILNAEIKATKRKLNSATDENLIDSYIYELSALNKRYQYYLKEAKNLGVRAFEMEG